MTAMNAILDFIDTTREEKIPVDGFQLSSGYCTVETDKGIKRCVFTWNKKAVQKIPGNSLPRWIKGAYPYPPT